VILKEESIQVILIFEGVVPFHTSRFGGNKNWGK
jgi:hypothetical protein